jgi:hypothetical protein
MLENLRERVKLIGIDIVSQGIEIIMHVWKSVDPFGS